MKAVISIFAVLLLFPAVAQTVSLEESEKHLSSLLDVLRKASSDAEKEQRNKEFKAELEKVLQDPAALTYPFASLTTVGFINSPDGKMRIVNWNVEQEDFSHTYNCFVLHVEDRRNEYHVTELKDISFGMPMQPTEIISSDEWYGALYYKIIPIEKSGKTLYTVLGWDYFSSMSQIRVIDVIYFTGKTVKLGSPVFKVGKETFKRMIYEHSKNASMSLLYEEQRHRIIFDHLSPESPSMAGFKSFYVPDLTYDAFVLESGKWVLHEDVIGTNPNHETGKQYIYVKNEKTGKVEKKLIKTSWINPEDANAPAGSSEHVAVTPETADEVEKQQNKEESVNEPKVNKKDKRDPSQLSFYKDMEKKKRKRRNP